MTGRGIPARQEACPSNGTVSYLLKLSYLLSQGALGLVLGPVKRR